MSVFSEIIPLNMKRAKELCHLCTYPSGMEMFEITHMFPSLVKRIEELETKASDSTESLGSHARETAC